MVLRGDVWNLEKTGTVWLIRKDAGGVLQINTSSESTLETLEKGVRYVQA